MSSISSMSGMSGVSSNTMMAQGMHHHRQRPDAAQMAEKLFSQLDTSGQGYLQKADLQAALDKTSASGNSNSTSSSVDDLFSQLDGNSDGKVTKDEFSSAIKKLAEQLDQQMDGMRMQGAMQAGMQGMGHMPPPPPPQNDSGFTKDELQSQLKEVGSSDSKRNSLISSIVQNFDKADTDGDGKVSFKEAMAFDQSQSSSSSTSSNNGTTGSSSSSSTSESSNAKVMLQILRLMQAYGSGQNADNSAASVLSLTA